MQQESKESDATYVVVPVDPARFAAEILALWASGLAQRGKPNAKFDWYYRNNPEGNPLVAVLQHVASGRAVGVAAVGPRRVRIGNVNVKAGALVDFVTLPEHRTFFPALVLQRELRSMALATYPLLFGFPNPKSLAVVRRIGHRSIGQMVRRSMILCAATYLDGRMPDWLGRCIGKVIDQTRPLAMALAVSVTHTPRALGAARFVTRWVDRPDASFDDLWRSVMAATPDVVMGVRDAAFLTWRFANSPLKTCRFFAVQETSSGRLAAYAVCSDADGGKHGKALNIDDFLVSPQTPDAGARLWFDLARTATRLGYASITLEFLGSAREQRRLACAGLLARGQRPVYASFAEDPRWAPQFLQNLAWYLTSADDD